MGSSRRSLPSLRPAGTRAPQEVLQIAHRGGSHGIEDYRTINLHRIAALGTHLVEIDIRMTADADLVVHHDPEIAVAERAVGIKSHRFADLAVLAPGRVPSAAAVFRAARVAGVGVYADLKDVADHGLHKLIRLLAAEDMGDRTILASADANTVARCAMAAPDIPRAVLFRSIDDDPITLARTASADFLHPCWEDENQPHKLLAGPWLAEVRGRGLGVVCWHEERIDVLAELLALGVDGICTDDPAVLAELATNNRPLWTNQARNPGRPGSLHRPHRLRAPYRG